MSDPSAGVKITSPATGQKIPVGELEVAGTSTDNNLTDCRVYVDINDIKPMQNTTASGSDGQNDYSNWTFTYTSEYHLISEGINELTAKLSCIHNPANVTKYYSVNVTGVPTSVAANDTAATVPAPVNQTQKQTLGLEQEPKQELQSQQPADSIPQQPKETQSQEEALESITNSQKGDSAISDALTAEPEEIKEDEEKFTELIESDGQFDYTHDQVQTDKEKLQPMETLSQPEESLGQQTIKEQESAPEIMEQQPLEEDQPLEVSSQPQESLEQQPLGTFETSQPLEESPGEDFGHETQPSPLDIQPPKQQPELSEQQASESTSYTQEQPSEIQEDIPFVLPFDSQDVVIPN
ncbi:MAG: hypothetical protein M3264_00145 [Thermoproteota archaeon]|nr:hypothetical protein [Thermoproteota archaeon]